MQKDKFKIQRFDKKNLQKAVDLYITDYLSEEFRYTDQEASNWINADLNESPDYCLEAVINSGVFLGFLIAYVNKHSTGNSLRIDSINIGLEYRSLGIGKKLIKEVVSIANSNGIKRISLLADGNTDFPRLWYEKIGFRPTGWVEYLGNIEDLNLD